MAARERFPVAIVGPGALGLYYASRLSKVAPTAVIARSAARARGLRPRLQAFGPEDLPHADWVIVLVKAHETAAAVRVARRMKPRGIVSLQNGLIEAVPQGVTTAAAYRDGGRLVPVAAGETLLPPGFGELVRHLRLAGFPARIARDIDTARYRKLLANVCLNPLTALFRVRNGEVRKQPYALFAEALAREAAGVLAAEGMRITAGQAVRRVMAVAAATAGNRSSMLQDILAGRRTEIDHLNGALLRIARRHGMSVPLHEAMTRLIRVMEPR